ncbi:helix-turn-helix transcriptional regulator [Bradyrhizobium sp. 2S1]|uniref:helix-turn-helix transcriptional regulator n=1 Tax=Bradyrhizobium sp. 2S1 TaxID=1404429 RepID=UPI0014080ACD|nr:helix-turn-helix domain-containing protein [Bradyrhizobium sp. 2S1]MCK7665836.1 helix-turn-helix domain-containing protein [Bradyrhizobium sp. 2S1]
MTNLLSQRDAAACLGLSPRTLERYRCTGFGPPYRKHGSRVLYHPADIEAWSAARVRTNTCERRPAQ